MIGDNTYNCDKYCRCLRYNDIVQHGTCSALGANECCTGDGLTKGTKDLKQSLPDYSTIFYTKLNSNIFFKLPGEGKCLDSNKKKFNSTEHAQIAAMIDLRAMLLEDLGKVSLAMKVAMANMLVINYPT